MKITICGSMAFYTQMEEVRDELIKRGYEAKIPQLTLEAPEEFGGGRKVDFGKYIEEHGGMDAFSPDDPIWDLKERAVKNHFEKVMWSDVVFITNYEKRGIEGYIGGNTLIEIGLAFYLQKKIFILNPISPELSYRQEIYGMKPILLHGNLDALPEA